MVAVLCEMFFLGSTPPGLCHAHLCRDGAIMHLFPGEECAGKKPVPTHSSHAEEACHCLMEALQD